MKTYYTSDSTTKLLARALTAAEIARNYTIDKARFSLP